MTPSALYKWILGVISALLVATIIGSVGYAQETAASIATLEERTASMDIIHRDVRQIAVDVSAILAHQEDLEKRLDRIDQRLDD